MTPSSASIEIFENVSYNNNVEVGYLPDKGFPRYSNLAVHKDTNKEPCIYVFGNSFSYASEVSDSEAWAHKLGSLLKCPVANYGVPGYGTDQAYLLMKSVLNKNPKQKSKEKKIILFGIYQEMLRRNMAASWLFYCCQDQKRSLKPLFVFSEDKKTLVLRKLRSEMTIDQVKKHHSDDRYHVDHELNFPYTLDVIKEFYSRLVSILPSSLAYRIPEVRKKQILLMELIVELAEANGYTVGFVYFPTPDQALKNYKSYQSFLEKLPSKLYSAENVFSIDLFSGLNKSSNVAGKAFKAEFGHYDAEGNKLIADIVLEELLN